MISGLNTNYSNVLKYLTTPIQSLSQRSQLNPWIFNHPFSSYNTNYILAPVRQKRGIKDLRLEPRSLTPRDHSFLPSYPPKPLNPSFADQKIPPKEIPFSRPTDGWYVRMMVVRHYIYNRVCPPVAILLYSGVSVLSIGTGGQTRLVYSMLDILHTI